MTPLITVVITAYNGESYIGRAIESLQAQTYQNIEILIVNDGSTDSTQAVCEAYAASDERIKIINQENAGSAAARRSGAENASGDYVGFMDDDDTVAPDMYELLLTNALQHDADISHCGYTMILPDGTQKHFHGTGKTVLQNHDRGIIDLLEGKFVEPTVCTKLYKRRLFDGISYAADITINEDLMLNYSPFSAAERSVFQDECKYYYYKHDDSKSRTMSAKQFTDPITVRERIVQLSQSESEAVQAIAKERLVSQYILNCFSIKTNGYKQYTDIYQSDRKHLKELYKTCTLSRNDRFKASLLLRAPFLCKPVDALYRLLHR